MKDIYITHYKQTGFLEYQLGYAHNHSGIYGYHGTAPYTIYDLHYISNLSEIRNAYVIIDYRYINPSEDNVWYYKDQNVSLEYLRTTPPPLNWYGIYGLTDENSTVVGGIWEVE